MITPKKIEEWIKEVEERPNSAPVILQYISNRLRDLTKRNEELLAENIALISGKRVEEYEQRIAHLEYQLELLKRQLGSSISTEAMQRADQATAELNKLETLSLLIYCQNGRMLRIEINPQSLEDSLTVGQIQSEGLQGEEPPRLLAISSTEEVLSIYTSGRIAAYPVSSILPVNPSTDGMAGIIQWEHANVPEEPRGGERLACLMPVSKLPLAEFFVQTSRRGFVKKIRTSMAQSILANHYIGSGVKQPLDRTFSICLSGKDDHIVLVSHEGYLLRLEMSRISSAVEEAIRLGSSDHLVSSFVYRPGSSILVMTQIGKAVQITEDRLEIARSLKTKGQPAFSGQRREKGARVVGAGSVYEQDWAAGLHQNGQIKLYSLREIFATGRLLEQSELISFDTFPSPSGNGKLAKVSKMSLRVGLDFGTSNSGVAVSDGAQVKILPIDPHNIMPEVVKTVLYITRDQQGYIGQEAVELYYRHNVNRVRRYVKKWAGEIDYVGSELHYVRDIFVYVDELKPGRMLQYLKSALRKVGSAKGYEGTQIFEQYYRVADLIRIYLSILKKRAEELLHDDIDGVTLGRPVKFSETAGD